MCARGHTLWLWQGVLADQLLYETVSIALGVLIFGDPGLFVEGGVESREDWAVRVKGFRSQEGPLETTQVHYAGCPQAPRGSPSPAISTQRLSEDRPDY